MAVLTRETIEAAFLARELGLTSSADALKLVLTYYPADRLPVRTRLLLEELLDDRA